VTIYLAVFAVAIGVGSGLASWLSAERIILLPTALGALLIGLFSLELGFALLRLPAQDTMMALQPSAFFARPIAWHAAFNLGILAVAGGLMIVPPSTCSTLH
jgi:acyl-[acyl-carrier-protein]-phospholipid O-acyltransferase/long-chain-fatty-acid--[acyl-carrier-protein] ligase